MTIYDTLKKIFLRHNRHFYWKWRCDIYECKRKIDMQVFFDFLIL